MKFKRFCFPSFQSVRKKLYCLKNEDFFFIGKLLILNKTVLSISLENFKLKQTSLKFLFLLIFNQRITKIFVEKGPI